MGNKVKVTLDRMLKKSTLKVIPIKSNIDDFYDKQLKKALDHER